MASPMAGLLSGAARGGFKAAGEIAEDKIQFNLDEQKAAALDKRQKNLLRLQQTFRTNEREAGQEFQTSERLAGQQEEEKKYQKRIAEEEKKYNRRLTEAEKKQLQVEKREQNRYDRFIAEKKDLPSNFKTTYNDIKSTIGADKADAYAERFVQSLGGKMTKGSKPDYKMQELWTNTFNDALERGEDLDTAQATADRVLSRFGVLQGEEIPSPEKEEEKSSLQQILSQINSLGTPATGEDSNRGNSYGEMPVEPVSKVPQVLGQVDDKDFGTSDKGYVVKDNGVWREPTEEERAKILVMAQKGNIGGSVSWSLPETKYKGGGIGQAKPVDSYTVPKGILTSSGRR